MLLSSSIPAIGKDGLASNPTTLVTEEAHQWCNILDVGQSIAQALALVEGNSFIRLLWVEEC